MSILTRFKDIMSSNINALLDKAEDPVKMVDQALRDLERDLNTVTSETAAIMAESSRTKREYDECVKQVNKYKAYAEKAVKAGNDDDARKFLTKKNEAAANLDSLKQSMDVATTNANNMKAMREKLVSDISSLNQRRQAVRSKMAVAKTQQRINKTSSSFAGAANSMSAFSRMEEKANRALDEANAMAELTATPKDDVDELMSKYDSTSGVEDELNELKGGRSGQSSVDDELAELKSAME